MFSYRSAYNIFHGTTDKFAEKIINEKKFIFTKRNNHWLGNGVYFFVDDYNKAKWWADQACKRRNRSGGNEHQPSVLFLEDYSVKRNEIIDLDTEQDRLRVLDFAKQLHSTGVLVKAENLKSVHEIRGALMNFVVRYDEDIKASKKTFTKPTIPSQEKLQQTGIENNEVQLCIYDLETIDFENVEIVDMEGVS